MNTRAYWCARHRDEYFRLLKAVGRKPTKRTARNVTYSPDYLADFQCYPYAITPTPTCMARLYIVEW